MISKIDRVISPEAPKALGSYSHATVYENFIFVSGMAARDPKTDRIPGLELNAEGERLRYDIRAETRGTLENIRSVLKSAGGDLDTVLEVNTYLTDMNDFAAYNEVYAQYFADHKPARTTIGVASLPGKISIEMKVIAVRKA